MHQRYDRSQRLAYRRFRSVADAAMEQRLLVRRPAGAKQKHDLNFQPTAVVLELREKGRETWAGRGA
jgi:hypothetical protein